jgi:protein-tyrosine-phosphatase
MPDERPFNVLFLCTRNSARSFIAECVMNRLGMGKFKGFSAGSHAGGSVHPYVLDLLRQLNYPTGTLRPKSWDEFAAPGAPDLDFVFTVCDDTANEICPVWPGQPMSAHWGVPDPLQVDGTESERRFAFADTHRMLYQRISIFTSLPFTALDRLALQKRLDEIGRAAASATAGGGAAAG